MAKKTNTAQWFKTKQSGLAWGLPASRKGLYAFAVFIAVWAAALWWLTTSGEPVDPIPQRNFVIFFVIILLDLIGMLWVFWKYGDLSVISRKRKTREHHKSATKAKS